MLLAAVRPHAGSLDAVFHRCSAWRTAGYGVAVLALSVAGWAAQPSLAQAPDAAQAQTPSARNAKEVHARFQQGVKATEQGKYDQAIEIFTALTVEYPRLPEPYNNLAVLYATKGDMRKAMDTLEQATRVNPGYATAYENLGDLYANLAGEAYGKAAQLDSQSGDLKPKLFLIQQIAQAQHQPTSASERTKVAGTPRAPAEPAAPAAPVSGIRVSTAETVSRTAQPAAAVAPAKEAAQADIEALVDTWAHAWAHQDLQGYYAAYSPNFQPLRGTLASWKSSRRDRILDKNGITLKIHDLKINVAGTRATAQFEQYYASGGYEDTTLKTLELRREGGQWRIVRETTSS